MQLMLFVIEKFLGLAGYWKAPHYRKVTSNLSSQKLTFTKGDNMAMKVTTVSSPCIKNCVQDADLGFCRGCYRTVAEKIDWHLMEEEHKLDTIILCQMRKEKLGDISAVNHTTFHFTPKDR